MSHWVSHQQEGSHWCLKIFGGAHGSCASVFPVFELGVCVAHECALASPVLVALSSGVLPVHLLPTSSLSPHSLFLRGQLKHLGMELHSRLPRSRQPALSQPL